MHVVFSLDLSGFKNLTGLVAGCPFAVQKKLLFLQLI